MSLQNSYINILTPNVTVSGSGAFGSTSVGLGHESGDFMKGINAVIIKETPEGSLVLHHVSTQREEGHL